MINQQSTKAFLLLFEDRPPQIKISISQCFERGEIAQRENVLHDKTLVPQEGFEPSPSPCLRSTLPDVTGTIHHDPPRLSYTIYAADMLIPHHNLNLKLEPSPATPGLPTNHDQIKHLLSGWFFLPPSETDVVLVHLRLELSTTDDNANDVGDIQPRPCATRFPRPASPTKSPTTPRFRDNTTNNNNTTNVNSSPTPRSRTNSLFDSSAGALQASRTSNAHPYPIRTTSTALLTRSNSTSSQQQNRGRHHCLPPPHPTSSNATANGDGNGGCSGGKVAGKRRGEYRGHRYSRTPSSSEGMAYGGAGAESPRAPPPGLGAFLLYPYIPCS
ncbi:hypothetical protein C8J57DRAFT_1576750 [Mycena rebaudengoi]|nr:hypothetical protein C8J57DRAFT_1576750 [Mycena rebaudengoi]